MKLSKWIWIVIFGIKIFIILPCMFIIALLIKWADKAEEKT